MDKKIKKEIIDSLEKDEPIPVEYEDILFPTTKKEYELKYAGKERKEVILNKTLSVPFQPVKQFGNVKEGEWHNMLIFGDNLQALKHLLKLKNEGKLKNPDGSNGVKLVYIDPPFGTGDMYDASGDLPAYSAKLEGVHFMEFLRKRLLILRELLSEDGSIFVRIDYHFGHYVKIIMDEVFDKNNFKNEIIINRFKRMLRDLNQFNVSTDSIFYYSKSERNIFHEVEKDRKCSFCGNDMEPVWRGMSSPGLRNPPQREIFGRTLLPPKGRHWTFTKDRITQLIKEKRIRINESLSFVDLDGKKIKGLPEYLQTDTVPVDSNWTDLKGYVFAAKYPTENPEELLERVINCASDKGDLVMDCFAGSGTTGAVAEKLGRRWIMCDCGKLSIYTMTKRLLNLKEEIGNKGKPLKPKAFVLYNAGLYNDKELINQMEGSAYKEFVLELFGCQKREHKINGLTFHGTLNNHSVMVFDKKHFLTDEFIDDLHDTIGSVIKEEAYIIAPVGIVGFNEDYKIKGKVRYTVLRIPNSIIEYIKEMNFTRLEQPRSISDINQTIDSVGFDFVYPPKVKAKYYAQKPKGKLIDKEYVIEIEEFEPIQLGSKIVEFKDSKEESIAMVMIDTDYDGDTFNLGKYFFGDEIVKNNYKLAFDDEFGENIMVIYLDIFGNERKEVIKRSDFKVT